MKLVSIIMPTRNDLKGLGKAIASITYSCTNRHGIEILLRIDDDDSPRIALIPTLESRGCKCLVGPRGIGYSNMGQFVDELVAVADSQWCWLFDDDAWVEGNWYEQLKDIDCDFENGPAVNLETYALGQSRYKNHANSAAGIIFPTNLAKQLKHRAPVDQQWLDEALDRKWPVVQLKGCTYFHDGRPRV